MEAASRESREARVERWVVAASFALYAGVILLRIGRDYASGGDRWRQGDWLINSAAGSVRRSLMGDLALGISDALGVGPLAVVTGLQAALVLFIFGALGLLLHRELGRGAISRRLSVLILSPPFVTFWARDPSGTMRKELLVAAAFCALLQATGADARSRATAWIATSLGLFSVAAFAHEALVLFLPFFLVALGLLARRPAAADARDGLSKRAASAWGLAFTAAAGAALGFALTHTTPPSVDPICEAITSRGANPRLCEGAIAYLGKSLSTAIADTAQWRDDTGAGKFAAYALLAALMTFILWPREASAARRLACIVAALLPFAPLYVVGQDWGRWIFFAGLGGTFLLVLDSQVDPTRRRPMSTGHFWAAYAATLVWRIPHTFAPL